MYGTTVPAFRSVGLGCPCGGPWGRESMSGPSSNVQKIWWCGRWSQGCSGSGGGSFLVLIRRHRDDYYDLPSGWVDFELMAFLLSSWMLFFFSFVRGFTHLIHLVCVFGFLCFIFIQRGEEASFSSTNDIVPTDNRDAVLLIKTSGKDILLVQNIYQKGKFTIIRGQP